MKIVLLMAIVGGSLRAADPCFPESESIWRGNISELKIDPFALRVVGNLYGEWGCFKAPAHGDGFGTGVLGGSVGVDRLFGKNVLFGLHAHSATIDIRPDNPLERGYLSSFAGLARMSLFGPLWYWDFGVGAGQNHGSDSTFVGENLVTGSRTRMQWNYETEMGFRLKTGFTKIEPFVGFRAINLDNAGRNFSTEGANSYRSFVGSRFSWEYATYMATLKPNIWGMWGHEFGDDTLFTTADSLIFPTAWEFGGQQMPSDRFLIGAGFSAAMRDMLDLFIRYQSDITRRYNAHTISAGFHVKY